ncbi:MAG: ribosomal subunit interface protein [Planctomycetaceae bacterium]|nr:ribosomal subunit interface protein [Planctomycetaceae bacterium]
MQVAVTCKHGTISPDIQEHLRSKSEKLLNLFERVTAINVTVSFDKPRCRVEILVDAEHKHDFVAHDEGDNVTATFDSALHKMEQQIRKYKEKVQDHRGDVTIRGAAPAE